MQTISSDDYVADYLVIDAGASGLAFIGRPLSESGATVIIIDNRLKLGGHWVDAIRLPPYISHLPFMG
jgi:ribulose 1,5-bisphosphate synthetase/thiazole synthase